MGQVTASVNNNSNNGLFDVTWSGAHPNGTNYAILATPRNAGGAVNFVQSSTTSTALRLATYALSTGSQTAYDWNLMTYP